MAITDIYLFLPLSRIFFSCYAALLLLPGLHPHNACTFIRVDRSIGSKRNQILDRYNLITCRSGLVLLLYSERTVISTPYLVTFEFPSDLFVDMRVNFE